MPETFQEIASKLYNGHEKAVVALVQEALEQGMAPEEILNKALIVGMDKVGQAFKDGRLFVPEVLMAARAMQAGLDLLRPFLAKSNISSAGKYVIGVVKGDLHDIGKNLVKMMMEGAGFETIDLGTDVPSETFVAAIKEHKPKIVGMSALLTTTIPQMKVTIERLKEAGLRSSVKVMVGGAPVTADSAQQIGADGYAPDAATAVDVARQLLSIS